MGAALTKPERERIRSEGEVECLAREGNRSKAEKQSLLARHRPLQGGLVSTLYERRVRQEVRCRWNRL
jgi:hypothetical protein